MSNQHQMTAIGISCGNLKVTGKSTMKVQAAPGTVAAGVIARDTILYEGDVEQSGSIVDDNGFLSRGSSGGGRSGNSSAGRPNPHDIINHLHGAGGGAVLNAARTIVNKKSMNQTIEQRQGVVVLGNYVTELLVNEGTMTTEAEVRGAPGTGSSSQ